ncbi:HAD-IA family hydrolase [Robertmurraya korlensis]|uniref:HAD-IA family hydrolase n=1 Tax=Robertmurraya korlensis TaxID=519977 RepID=UPI000B2B7416|nr:HAD-IA family hydrolase [Robertmurraya korlensis]
MIKYVVFDFDGTLVDSKYAFQTAWNILADKYGFGRIETNQIHSLKNMTFKERSKLLHFPLYKIPMVVPELTRLYRESMKNVHFFDGMKNTLLRLSEEGFQIAIISSNSEDNIRAFLKENDLARIVTEVMCSSRIFGKDKVISRFLNNHKLQASEMVYVGDESRDIIACKRIGVKVIWVGWGFDAEEIVTLHKPDYLVYSPHELENLLLN